MSGFNDYRNIFESIGVDTSNLGCVMLDCEPLSDKRLLPSDFLYESPNPDHWWIKGWVADKPHITLKYGLLRPADEWRPEIDELLRSWTMPMGDNALCVRSFTAWPSPYPDENYACVVGLVFDNNELDPVGENFNQSLRYANDQLSYLPHVDTFNTYRPHITVAYVNTDDALTAVNMLNGWGSAMSLKPIELNYGSEH